MINTGYDPLQHTSVYYGKEDSDDSDGEGGLGNVNRQIMRPPGHSGKAKRGHLCFDASFECGNLGRVDLINEFEYDLFIRPDTCSPRLRFWFNFTVDNVKLDQRVIFNIVNISKERNLFMEKMTPIVKSSSRPKWQRIPKKHVYYHKSTVHQGHYIFSFSFGFDKEEDIFQFALAPPYSYSKLQAFLPVLDKKASHLKESFSRELLANSVQSRRVDLITIGSLDPAPKSKAKRRIVFIMARIHPGETPASFVCQGLLELLISSNSIASILRDNVTFKVIPMLNPDGVFLGNYRSTVMGTDLNRSWHVANQWLHPTSKAVIDILTILDKSKDFQLDFVIDIHAHSSLTGCFVYGNTYGDVYRYERHILFPKLLATTADDYAAGNTMFNSDATKAGTARRYLCSLLSDKVNCYSFEISIYGYKLKGSDTIIPYTEESYMRCGRNLVRTFFEYYTNTGAIAFHITAEVSSKRTRSRTAQIRRRNQKHGRNRTPLTGRIQAQLHFTNLNINYDSETSLEDCTYSYRYTSPRKAFDKISEQYSLRKSAKSNIEQKHNFRSDSPIPTTYVVLPEPSLTVIDFNVMSRDDIDKVSKVNKIQKKSSQKFDFLQHIHQIIHTLSSSSLR
ncbi:cytosolic carboxypeptidase 6 [Dendroctonus ponderosae]|uniref:cytosolic carboxypeptidase 6 n=1 Tax=Dendroctonus ponderosae TaxID=77166 RepID=UPI00203660F1|nr:cytosolic carboxypeptidase 6 [Dendroctonus ponderosae]